MTQSGSGQWPEKARSLCKAYEKLYSSASGMLKNSEQGLGILRIVSQAVGKNWSNAGLEVWAGDTGGGRGVCV